MFGWLKEMLIAWLSWVPRATLDYERSCGEQRAREFEKTINALHLRLHIMKESSDDLQLFSKNGTAVEELANMRHFVGVRRKYGGNYEVDVEKFCSALGPEQCQMLKTAVIGYLAKPLARVQRKGVAL